LWPLTPSVDSAGRRVRAHLATFHAAELAVLPPPVYVPQKWDLSRTFQDAALALKRALATPRTLEIRCVTTRTDVMAARRYRLRSRRETFDEHELAARPARARTTVLLIALLFLVSKLVIAAMTYGTNDVSYWIDFARGVALKGPVGVYGRALLRISAMEAASSRWTSRVNGTQPYFHHAWSGVAYTRRREGSLCGPLRAVGPGAEATSGTPRSTGPFGRHR